ncbi:MAG: glycosyltransferase family 2 protein [Actinomycetota bacterium]
MNKVPSGLDVEVSVVNHGDCELSRSCLSSLPVACEGLKWHATLVDNASDDGSAEILMAAFPELTVICNSKRHGFGENQNQVIGPAVESGNARYVLVLNNDTELGEGSVSELVKCADNDPKLGAVGPLTYNVDGSRQPSSFRFPTLAGALLSEVYPRAAPLGCEFAEKGEVWLGGACLLLRSDALRDVALFDTRFFLFFEDVDLARRLRDRGWGSALCAESTIMHHNHKTVEREDLQFPMACQLRRSYYLYVRKYHGTVAAASLAMVGRAALRIRAGVDEITGRLRHDEEAAERAAALRSLALYDPRRALPHELTG